MAVVHRYAHGNWESRYGYRWSACGRQVPTQRVEVYDERVTCANCLAALAKTAREHEVREERRHRLRAIARNQEGTS